MLQAVHLLRGPRRQGQPIVTVPLFLSSIFISCYVDFNIVYLQVVKRRLERHY